MGEFGFSDTDYFGKIMRLSDMKLGVSPCVRIIPDGDSFILDGEITGQNTGDLHFVLALIHAHGVSTTPVLTSRMQHRIDAAGMVMLKLLYSE